MHKKVNERLRAMKIHGVMLAIGLLFNAAALGLLWWDGAHTSYVGGDFSYSADVIATRNAYNPQNDRFFGTQYSKASFHMEAKNNGSVVASSFGPADSTATVVERPVNAARGEYTDKHASGPEYIFAPRDVTEESQFYSLPPGTDTPLLMKYDDQEMQDGLLIYRFKGERTVEHPANVLQTSLKFDEVLSADQTYQIWVEPSSGWLVKYANTEVLNVVRDSDHGVLRPAGYVSDAMDPQSVSQHIAYAKSLRASRLFITQVGPSTFVVIIMFVAALVAIMHIKRPRTVPLAVGVVLLVAVPGVVLAGWSGGVMPLTQLFFGGVATNPLVALCFMLIGVAIWALHMQKRIVAVAIGAGVAAVSLTQLLAAMGVISFQPDLLLFGEAVQKMGTVPSRMSPFMSFALLVFGGMLFSTALRRTPPQRFVQFALALTMMLGVLGVIFNATQINSAVAIPFVQSLSLVGSLLLSIGALVFAQLIRGLQNQPEDIVHIVSSLRWPALAALPVVVIGIFAQVQQHTVQHDLEVAFNARIADVESAVQNRFALLTNTLLGTRGLLLASQEVTADEWSDYYNAYKMTGNTPSLTGVGYALLNHDTAPIKYIEPEAQKGQIGRDLMDDAVLRETVHAAVTSGEVRLSGNVTGPSDSGAAEAYIVVPVFAKNAILGTQADRERNVQGFVFGVVALPETIRTTASPYVRTINFEVYNGTEVRQDMLLYQQSPNRVETPRLAKQTTLFTDGQAWTFLYAAESGFRLSPEQEFSPTAILLGGSATYFGFLTAAYLLLDINRERQRLRAVQKAGRQDS